MKFEITKEEVETIEKYKNERYCSINQLLCDDIESLLHQGKLAFTEEETKENMAMIKTIYESMIKNSYNHFRRKWDFL